MKNCIFTLYFVVFTVIILGSETNAQSRKDGFKLIDYSKNLTANVALSYIAYTDSFRYGGMFTAFRKRTHQIEKKWEINCSTFSILVALGIRFKDSLYGGGENIPYVSKFPNIELIEFMKTGTEGMQSSYVFSQHIAQWLYQKGFCFYPNIDFSNVETGDIVFFNNVTSDNENSFSGIDHSGIFAYHVHENLWGVWEVQNAGPVYAEYTHNFNSKVVLCARLPKETHLISMSHINIDSTKKHSSEERNLRPLINLSRYKRGKQYTLIAKIEYTNPDLTNYPGIHDSKNVSLCSYHNFKERPLDGIYKLSFVPQTEDDCLYLDTRVSVSGTDMNAKCDWAFVYEGLLL